MAQGEMLVTGEWVAIGLVLVGPTPVLLSGMKADPIWAPAYRQSLRK